MRHDLLTFAMILPRKQCPGCCSCFASGDLPNDIPSNSCNTLGECCTTLSPTTAPTRSPTRRPTNRPTPFPTRSPTPFPTPQPTTAPTQRPTPSPTPAPTVGLVTSLDISAPSAYSNFEASWTTSLTGYVVCGVTSYHLNQ